MADLRLDVAINHEFAYVKIFVSFGGQNAVYVKTFLLLYTVTGVKQNLT